MLHTLITHFTKLQSNHSKGLTHPASSDSLSQRSRIWFGVISWLRRRTTPRCDTFKSEQRIDSSIWEHTCDSQIPKQSITLLCIHKVNRLQVSKLSADHWCTVTIGIFFKWTRVDQGLGNARSGVGISTSNRAASFLKLSRWHVHRERESIGKLAQYCKSTLFCSVVEKRLSNMYFSRIKAIKYDYQFGWSYLRAISASISKRDIFRCEIWKWKWWITRVLARNLRSSSFTEALLSTMTFYNCEHFQSYWYFLSLLCNIA